MPDQPTRHETTSYSAEDLSAIEAIRRALPPGTPDALAVAKARFDAARLVEAAGGMHAVERALGISGYAVNAWLNGRGIPAEREQQLRTIASIRASLMGPPAT